MGRGEQGEGGWGGGGATSGRGFSHVTQKETLHEFLVPQTRHTAPSWNITTPYDTNHSPEIYKSQSRKTSNILESAGEVVLKFFFYII